MNLLKNTIYNGWPPYRKQCPQELWEVWNFRCDLTLEDSLVLKGSRIVVPASMRNQVLQAIHLGHQGENKCILRARESVFWPGISADIRQMVKDCNLCDKHKPAQPRRPILQPDLPTQPWEKLGTDIFEFNKEKYLMVVDYYSRFPVIRLLNDMTSHTPCATTSQASLQNMTYQPLSLPTSDLSSSAKDSKPNANKVASHYTVVPHTTTKPTAWQRGQLEPASHC